MHVPIPCIFIGYHFFLLVTTVHDIYPMHTKVIKFSALTAQDSCGFTEWMNEFGKSYDSGIERIIITPSFPTVPLVTPCASCFLDSDCHCLSLHYHSSCWSYCVVFLGVECCYDYQWHSAQLTDFLTILEVSLPSFYYLCSWLEYLSPSSGFSFLSHCCLLSSLPLMAVSDCRWTTQGLSPQRIDSKVWRTV